MILLEHLYVFQHKHKSHIIGAIFDLRSSHLFRDQPYKEVLEVKCQACNFTGVFDVFFCRTSHKIICNKFAILKNKKLTKILEVGKFSSYVRTVSLTVKNHQFVFLIG